MRKIILALFAMLALTASAEATNRGRFVLVQSSAPVFVQPVGFQFQSFGAFGVFQPTNDVFVQRAFFAPAFVPVQRAVFVQRPSVTVIRTGLFGRTTIIQR